MDGGIGRLGTSEVISRGENSLFGELGVDEMLPEKEEEAEL